MNKSDPRAAELRKRAEETLKSKPSSIENMPMEDMRKLVEELQIHQVELEMQNEELLSTQRELEQSRKKYSDLYDFAPVGYLTIDEEGRILKANLTAAKLLGIEKSNLIGKPFNLYAAESYREELHLHLRKVFKTRQPHRCEVKLNGRRQTEGFVQLDTIYAGDTDDRGIVRMTMTDISDRKQAEENLTFAAKLEQSNHDLEQFAFIASHDLQEPLRKIQNFGDMLGRKYGNKLDETAKDYITRMQSSADRMAQLIRDLLKFSRLATRSGALRPIDLREAAREAISDLDMKIQRVGALINISDLPTIEAEQSQTRQLFQNLIANSLKFRREEEKPRIKIYSSCMDSECQIFVEDNGIGFDEKFLDRIFVPFQRLHGRSAYEGTGMGLAICRKIVERYRGSITAKSDPGKGSTFIVTLPVR